MKQGAHHLHQSSVIAAPTKKLPDSSGVLLRGSPRLTTQMSIWAIGEKGFLCNPKKFLGAARPTTAFFGRLRNEIVVRDFLRIVMPSLLSKESFLKQGGHVCICIESARFVRRVKNLLTESYYQFSSTSTMVSKDS